MLKPNESTDYPFMHQLKIVETNESKKKILERKLKHKPDGPQSEYLAIKEKFMSKFKKIEHISIDKTETIKETEDLKKLVKVKSGVGEESCLFFDVIKGKEENKQTAEKLEGLGDERNEFTKVWDQEQKFFEQLEGNLEQELEEKRVGYEKEIEKLNEKLQKLNRELGVYEKFLRISVKKSKDDYICTATKGNKEMVFSFICSGFFTTYVPLQVNFQSSNFLNYKIEDLNRQELNILFSRLLKVLHSNCN